MIGAFIKRQLGVITVSQDADHVIVSGVSRLALEFDIQKQWKTTVVANQMFSPSNHSVVKLQHFWVLDFLYILNTLYETSRWTRTPKRTLKLLIEQIESKTWISQTKVVERKPVDLKPLDRVAVFTPLDYQSDFIRHYLHVVPAFRLKGYMLHSDAGTGKTLTNLFLSHILNPDGVKVFIVPKNSVNTVWVDTLKQKWNDTASHWHSLSNEPLVVGHKYYIFHYEQLDRALEFFKTNQRQYKDVYVGLDESHNFNGIGSDRTKYFLQLCALPMVTNVVWSSGTPISKLGSECIPFLKCIDPYFKGDVEARFRKIYGTDAKRGLDILKHRIGHLKYHIPSADAIDIETHEIEWKITVPDGARWTMEEITRQLKAYMDDRTKYYAAHRRDYEDRYSKAISHFTTTPEYKKDIPSFTRYQSYVTVIARGYDPVLHKVEAQYCNTYENKTIAPALPSKMREGFRSAKSVVKYVHLKVLGETLGLLSRYRSACFKDMVPHMKLPDLIDNAKKKTLIFSSYVDVVEATGKYLESEGYKPVLVYGETNKDLSKLIHRFKNDPDANPLVATYQSLSTAVPLVEANRVILTNQPFRERIKIQSVARAARKDQDSHVDVFNVLLDTDGKENISTRNQDIMEWSAEMVKAILGNTNLDLDTLSLESIREDLTDDYIHPAEPELVDYPIPHHLYYAQVTGVDTVGDVVPTTDPDAAIVEATLRHLMHQGLIGEGSGYSLADQTLTSITANDRKPVTKNDVSKGTVVLYTLDPSHSGWEVVIDDDGHLEGFVNSSPIEEYTTRTQYRDMGFYFDNWYIKNEVR